MIAATTHRAEVRGKLRYNEPLRRHSWFRTGGAAAQFFEPADCADLQAFMMTLTPDTPLMTIGVGSNLLVRDGGLDGVTIRLGRGFDQIDRKGDLLYVGAAAMDVHVARRAAESGLSGMEFLAGIPGTIGGAVAMNAGAYGTEMADILVSADIISRDGGRQTWDADQFQFHYRRSAITTDHVIVSAVLRGQPAPIADIQDRMNRIISERAQSQPLGTRTGGSTFKNPSGAKAWELIDQAGCRGLSVGDAVMSDKHCNFMINTGAASADDLEQLGEQVRARVLAHSGVQLDWEVRRVGKASAGGEGQ